ncbi:class I glutamine amidotransferase-like protein [Hyaloscypha variabilis F]|uniref:Class I glutamine amidotransferase-like protein n=1 Tax=Hyaloscypha variabilis (strain UAMH 11265 / GT02V1 / F) TaxID=1149755 RepID=A0A2J6RHE4_HYAVF|nr:class I glutamine amidotransferase-like protein [Hyaloscypha variabilis F]
MSDPINLSKPHRPIRAGVILANSQHRRETEILDVAPIDIFNALTKKFVHNFPEHVLPEHLRAQALDFEFHWVNETGKAAHLTAGGIINPTDSFATCPPLDIVLMGAHDVGYNLNDAELAFIRKSFDECVAFITICGGFLAALQAGLLEGKTATGPRPMLDGLRQMAPGVKWVEKRWVRDGKLWTSGALLNGLDLTRAFATEYWGGKDTLVEFCLELGSYPVRDVNYADVQGKL